MIRPVVPRLAPVRPEQRVGILHQLRQRFVRLGLAVEILGHRRIAVDVVELRPQRPRVRQRVVADDDPRCFHQPRLDCVVQPEVRDDPLEERRVGAGLAGRRERRRREVEAALDAPGLVQPVEPLDPAGRLVEVEALLGGRLLADLHLGGLAIGMVRLVVDHDDVLVGGEPAEHPPGEGLVGLRAFPHHRAFRLSRRHQRVPVLDQDLGLVQLLAQRLGGGIRRSSSPRSGSAPAAGPSPSAPAPR